MSTLPRDAIGATTTRVLLAVLAGHRTHRSICRALGRSQATVNLHLRLLRDAGLVTWNEGQQGTLRPLVGIREEANR